MKTLIISPTYNERKNIQLLVKKVLDPNPDYHLLVVDDNSVNRKVAKAILFKAGCKIRSAKNGYEAISAVQKIISSDPRVFAVYDVTGDWDSMVLARVKNRADLDDLTKTVFTLEGVTRSFTHVVLNTVKEDGLPKPATE